MSARALVDALRRIKTATDDPSIRAMASEALSGSDSLDGLRGMSASAVMAVCGPGSTGGARDKEDAELLEDHIPMVEEMKRTGGSFIQALALCIQRADLDNLRKLRAAFPWYWERYRSLAARRKEEGR